MKLLGVGKVQGKDKANFVTKAGKAQQYFLEGTAITDAPGLVNKEVGVEFSKTARNTISSVKAYVPKAQGAGKGKGGGYYKGFETRVLNAVAIAVAGCKDLTVANVNQVLTSTYDKQLAKISAKKAGETTLADPANTLGAPGESSNLDLGTNAQPPAGGEDFDLKSE